MRVGAIEPEAEIESAASDAEMLQFDFREPCWESGADIKSAVGGVGAQSQDSMEHLEDRAGGPGLGNVGTAGIESGEVGMFALAMEASVDFGETVSIEAAGG